MSRAQKLSELKQREKVGKTYTCVIDSVEKDHLICRSIFDAPEIDGIVSVPNKQNHHRVGEHVTVKIIGSSEYDLEGKLLLY
jgi:ribosomal protein S12 methylthiotransferase